MKKLRILRCFQFQGNNCKKVYTEKAIFKKLLPVSTLVWKRTGSNFAPFFAFNFFVSKFFTFFSTVLKSAKILSYFDTEIQIF